MKIAIKFGDNDFGNTFIGVLKAVLEIYNYNGVIPTKAELVNFINDVSKGFFYARQHNYEVYLSSKDYLKIAESQILMGDEVDLFEDNNSETFILDTDLDLPGNRSVFSI